MGREILLDNIDRLRANMTLLVKSGLLQDKNDIQRVCSRIKELVMKMEEDPYRDAYDSDMCKALALVEEIEATILKT